MKKFLLVVVDSKLQLVIGEFLYNSKEAALHAMFDTELHDYYLYDKKGQGKLIASK